MSTVLQKMEKKYNKMLPSSVPLDSLTEEEKSALWNCDIDENDTSLFIKALHRKLVYNYLVTLERTVSTSEYVSPLPTDDVIKVMRLCLSEDSLIKSKAMDVFAVLRVRKLIDKNMKYAEMEESRMEITGINSKQETMAVLEVKILGFNSQFLIGIKKETFDIRHNN